MRVLDAYAPGWTDKVRSLDLLGTRVIVTYRLTLPCAEGVVWREAIGQASDWDEDEAQHYGDPSSNAEAMALKRAAAKFGVGLGLYDKDQTAGALVRHFMEEQLIEELGKLVDTLPLGRQQVIGSLTTLSHISCRAQHAGQCGVEVEGGHVPTPDWMLNLQILTLGGFR